jgi:hypothetical protein
MEEMDWVYLEAREIGGGKKFVKVDADYDGEYFSQYKWRVGKNGYIYRSERIPGAPARQTKIVYLHREVLKPPKGMWTHFKNGDHTDCRSCNLEALTPREVIANREMVRGTRKSKSGYRGARQVMTSRVKKGERVIEYYNAYFSTLAGVANYGFKTIEDAARDYDKRAKERYGDRAVLNFPEEV